MISRIDKRAGLVDYMETIGGKRPHRRHAKPLTPEERRAKAADLRAKGKREHGDSISWTRRCLYKRANCAGGKWTEIDLVQIANSGAYSVRTIRAAFEALREDPSFTMNIDICLHQKRLKKNGTFVIMVALQSWLLGDRLPLYRHTDGTKRHLRRRLREPDLPEPDRRGSAITRNTISYFSSFGQQIEINKLASEQNPSSVAAGDTDSSNCDALTALGNEKGNESPETLKKTSHDDLRPNLNWKPPRWIEGQLLSDAGRKSLNRKVEQTLCECRSRHWDNCKVKFEGSHAWVFIFQAMRNGQPDALIKQAWEYGIKKAHADSVDGLARVPSALALSHSRRFLENHTTGTLQERIDANYRKKRFYKKQPKIFSGSKWKASCQQSVTNLHEKAASPFPSQSQNTHSKIFPAPSANALSVPVSPQVQSGGLISPSVQNQKHESTGAKKHLSSWAEKVNATLDKIKPAGFHPGQVQTGGSPGASAQAAVPTPPLQTSAKTKPGYQAKNPEDAAASKRGVAHLHGFLSSLEEEDRQERLKEQAKKDIKKS